MTRATGGQQLTGDHDISQEGSGGSIVDQPESDETSIGQGGSTTGGNPVVLNLAQDGEGVTIPEFPIGCSAIRSPDRVESSPGSDPDIAAGVEQIELGQFESGSSLSVPVLVGNYPTSAVVDTAAQVSIISDRLFHLLDPKPAKLRDVVLHTAGRDMTMRGTVVGPLSIELGGQKLSEELYVAPIADNMLLGLDLLSKHQVAIHLQQPHLLLRGENIPLWYEDVPGQSIARIHTQRRTVVPPNVIKRITGVIDQRLGGSKKTKNSIQVGVLAPPNQGAGHIIPTVRRKNLGAQCPQNRKGTALWEEASSQEVGHLKDGRGVPGQSFVAGCTASPAKQSLDGPTPGPTQKLKVRGLCPMPGCQFRPSGKLRQHVYGHMPAALRLCQGRKSAEVPAKQRVACLRYIAQALTGSPSLEGLTKFVNEEALDARGWNVPKTMEEEMCFFLECLGEPIPGQISVCPLNTYAALLHWRILAWLISKLDKNQVNQLHRLGKVALPGNTAAPLVKSQEILAGTPESTAMSKQRDKVLRAQPSSGSIASAKVVPAAGDVPFSAVAKSTTGPKGPGILHAQDALVSGSEPQVPMHSAGEVTNYYPKRHRDVWLSGDQLSLSTCRGRSSIRSCRRRVRG